jgi:peptidoglycan/xylan/chitin deacetylase (PgdA/CDA1 family)
MSAVVISLDFELRWGLLDILRHDLSRYRGNLEGVRDAVPRLLELFVRRNVSATWATVGALACSGWDEWRARAPAWPRYLDPNLAWSDDYARADPQGRLYFAPELVDAVAKTPGQELGSHTFSHLYLGEPGVTETDVLADGQAMAKLFKDRFQRAPKSFVFPRNQVAHTRALTASGVAAWRENPHPFFWQQNLGPTQSLPVRALRLADAFAPLGRRSAPSVASRASYFIRFNLPEALWRLHVRRIAKDLQRARPSDSLHLWWHPHNLGATPARSVARVGELLDALHTASKGSARFASMGEAALAA